MHSAHFPAQAMSLNVFCSCGPSGGPIQINLPDHLCLLDKTWHIGFLISPASYFLKNILLSRDISYFWCFHSLATHQLWQNSHQPIYELLRKAVLLTWNGQKKQNKQKQLPNFKFLPCSLIFCLLAGLFKTTREFTRFPNQINHLSPQKSGFMHQLPHYPLCGKVVSFF